MKFTVFFVGLLMAMVSSVQAQTAPSVVSLSSSSRPYQGQAITLSVSVNGTLPFTYQWSKNGVPIAGATSITYTIPTIVQTDTGSYTVTVTNAGGSVTSGVILLDVQAATIAKLSYQPSNVSYNVGDAINLYASVYNATAPVTVVWKKDGNIIATVSNSYSYSIANAQATDAGTYTFTVTNAAGSLTSNPFTVTVTPVTAPVFTNSPSNTTATVGGYFSFYAYLSSTNGVSYQWYKDGVAIAGANNYYYSKGNAALTDAGVYSVVATNSTGSTTSGGATLVVQPAPPVTAPSGVYLNSLVVFLSSGDYLNLYASVPSGTAPYTYQWRKDGVDIPGATSSGYTKSGFSAADVGAYSVVVSNSAGSVLSRDTTVGMYSPTAPTILGNPQSVAVSAGSYVSLGVNATGTMPLAYQWQKDGVAIPGANGSSYYLYAASASNAGSYTVVVSNPYGSVTSTPGKLALLPAAALAITSQPTSTSVSPIGTLSLYVSATGQSNLTYQWKKDGVAIAGATDSYLYIYNPASSDSGLYTVDVSDSTGTVTSAPATVTVNAVTSPVIVVQPSNASLLVGDQGSLYVGIAKSQLDSIQWYRNGVAIPGATSQSIYVYGQPSYAGTYHAVVTNGAGSVTSRDATITVDFFATRPAIISISASQLVVGGSPATLNVGVNPALTGTSIVWKKDGTVVPNATSGNLYLNNFGLADAGTYTAEVTVSGVTTVSAPIALDLLNKNVAPTIITQTGPLAVAAGTYSSLIVTADGEAPFTYQWTKDGVAIPNATSSSYYINNMAASYVGNYNVTVTNRVGSVSGTPAALTLSPSAVSSKPPVITAQPVSQTWNVSTSAYATVSVTAMYTPDGSTTYTWYKDGVVVGSNSYYLAYGTVTAALAGRYKVVITNSAGSTTSDEAVITVVSPPIKPAFTTQPAAQTAYIGGPASFSAAASGASTVSYQWRKDGVAMAGATNATLTLSNLQAGDAGEYSVIATNAEGSISSAGAILTLLPSVAPTISTQPVSQWLMVDAAASISVTATGTPAPSYQWTRNGVAIAGATGPTLAFNALAETDAGTYAVVVSNYGGSVTSAAGS